MSVGGRRSTAYCKKSLLGRAFEILADQEAAGRRRDRDDPEEVVQQPDGNQAAGRRRGRHDLEEAVQQPDENQLVDVLVLRVAPSLLEVGVLVLLVAPNLVAPALSLVGLVVSPALLRQIEVNRELAQERPAPTGGIALEKTPGGTTGDTGQSEAQLGSASAWPRDPVTRLPSLLRGPPITTGAAFIMYRRGQVM